MPDRNAPTPHYPLGLKNAGSLLRLMRPLTPSGVQVDRTAPALPPAVPDPTPFEVRIRRGVGNSVFIVGHDRQGRPIAELRIPERHLCTKIVRRMERWCRTHDDDPMLHLIP